MLLQLHRLQSTNAQLTRQIKELSDLRHVIARMLGLNVDTLAVADYEIIARLESCVQGQHIGAVRDQVCHNKL